MLQPVDQAQQRPRRGLEQGREQLRRGCQARFAAVETREACRGEIGGGLECGRELVHELGEQGVDEGDQGVGTVLWAVCGFSRAAGLGEVGQVDGLAFLGDADERHAGQGVLGGGFDVGGSFDPEVLGC